jgi:2-succinyl-6-hydroxy-2,4-cyclohexadiene-1-carboxylate synthase
MKPAARSSWWMCTASRPSAARASAIGVDRDPGAITACRTPARTHSSTSVAQNVGWSDESGGALTWPSDQIGHTDRVRLFAEVDGRGSPLVLVHGFAQNRNCWPEVVARLALDHQVVRVDAPGHGRSAGIAADPWTAADLVAEAGGRATYVGYSMGGRLVLHAAIAHPGLVHRAVVIGATGGIEDPSARQDRRRQDEELARRLEADGVEAFLGPWLAQPLFAELPEPMRFWDERLTNTAAGLASSLRLAGTGAQEPLWGRLAGVEAPTLVMAGADDAKFSAEARRLVDAIGANAEMAVIPGAGHSPHLERPDDWLAALDRWLVATAEAGLRR